MMIMCWNGWNDIILFSCCLTRLYVVIICDAYIILYSILGIQTRLFWFLSLTEGIEIVVNSIADDVWGSEYELTGAQSEKVESWYLIYLKNCPMSLPATNSGTNNIKR